MDYGDLRIYREEQLLIKYYVIKHLIWLKIQNMMVKYDGYQRDFASVVYKFFFDKKSSGGVVKSEMMQNKQLVEELHKTIIRKLEKESILIF